MKHLQKMTMQPAMEKQDDAAGLIFLQIWLSVMATILTKGFSR
jgi:hypothetical protein